MTGKILILFIRLYKMAVSPLLPPSCRFYPSCSDYAADAVKNHGPLWGSVLALKRLLRCHPFNAGGYDPVPKIRQTKGPHIEAGAGKILD